MRSTEKELTRIKDILDIDGDVVIGHFDDFDNNLSKINFGDRGIAKTVNRFLIRKGKEIKEDLLNGKIVKVNSSIGIYTLFVPSRDNKQEYFILSPYLENHISVEVYQEILAKQGLVINEYISEVLFSIPVISKKKFNYLLELIAGKEEIDYLNEIAVYEDSSVKSTKKATYDKQYVIKEVLESQAKFKGELLESIVKGDITRIMMIFDLKRQEVIGEDLFNLGDNVKREKMYYINDMLHAVVSNSEANLLDVDALWVKIKNQLDNYDFSEDVIRKYCLLIDKERYKNKQQVVRNCILYINDHIREKISLNDVSDSLGVNKSYLSSIFNREMGYSIVDYIHDKRIANAKYLLANTDFSISEIADYIGYFDTSYFIRIFKSLEKTTPLKYRESAHK